jgi:hypothetical protein
MMLEEMYHAKKLDILSKYYIVSKSHTMQGDFRYKACDEKDREELFQDFLDQVLENEREVRKETSVAHV